MQFKASFIRWISSLYWVLYWTSIVLNFINWMGFLSLVWFQSINLNDKAREILSIDYLIDIKENIINYKDLDYS